MGDIISDNQEVPDEDEVVGLRLKVGEVFGTEKEAKEYIDQYNKLKYTELKVAINNKKSLVFVWKKEEIHMYRSETKATLQHYRMFRQNQLVQVSKKGC